jgi:hypothetical protein
MDSCPYVSPCPDVISGGHRRAVNPIPEVSESLSEGER